MQDIYKTISTFKISATLLRTTKPRFAKRERHLWTISKIWSSAELSFYKWWSITICTSVSIKLTSLSEIKFWKFYLDFQCHMSLTVHVCIWELLAVTVKNVSQHRTQHQYMSFSSNSVIHYHDAFYWLCST